MVLPGQWQPSRPSGRTMLRDHYCGSLVAGVQELAGADRKLYVDLVKGSSIIEVYGPHRLSPCICNSPLDFNLLYPKWMKMLGTCFFSRSYTEFCIRCISGPCGFCSRACRALNKGRPASAKTRASYIYSDRRCWIDITEKDSTMLPAK